MRAADALCEALKAEGVKHVFGIPGGASLPLYDALYDADFEHVQVRHEQCAGHAAEGYAKASGNVGVAFATSGPGATNLVTAIADAHMDSVPTVFITGQVRTDLIGTDGFQEADVTGITLPIVKHSFLVTDPAQIPDYVHKAFHIAKTGRPGPVLVDIPQDLSQLEIDYEPIIGTPKLPGYQPTTEGNIKQIRIAAKAMANSRRPVLYAGGGVINAGASEELRELAASDNFPVTCTLMGLGGFPAPHDAVARDARHARHPDRQLRDGRGRPDRRDRRPLRRPDHRQAERVRPAREVRPHRRRPGGDLQERPRPHPDRRRRQERAAEADQRVPGARRRRLPPRRLVGADPGLAGAVPAALRGLDRSGDQAAVHGRGDVPGHRGRRDHHLRRRPAPDVGGAVLPLRQAEPVAQLRRAGDDGLRPAGGDRRQGRDARRAGRLPRRRRQPDHGLPGVRDRRGQRPPGQGLPDEQRPLRHGPAVAGAVLGRALQVGRDGPEPRLGEARRGVRLDRHALRSARTSSPAR